MCMGVCVSVCAWKRERVSCLLPSLALCFALSLFPPSLHFSSPLSGFSPLSSSTLSFYHLFLLCLCLSFSPSLPFFPPPPLLSLPPSLPLSPPLSFSSRASLLAVDVTEAEAEATLPLIGCHSQVSDKEKGREKNETKKHGGEGRVGGGGENTALTSQWASVDCGIEKQGRLEAEEEGGLWEGIQFFSSSFLTVNASTKLCVRGGTESDCSDGLTVWCLMSKAIGPI